MTAMFSNLLPLFRRNNFNLCANLSILSINIGIVKFPMAMLINM